MAKARIDAVVAERGLVEPDAELLVDAGPRFVSRGGIKLGNALEALGIDLASRDCLDVGASTGGFARDCPRAAQRPSACPLRPGFPAQPRGRRRLLHLAGQGAAGRGWLPGAWRRSPGDGQAAVRAGAGAGPQGRRPRRGDRRKAILGVAHAVRALGLPIRGFASSELPGPKGNRETFVWCGGAGGDVVDLEASISAVEP